MKVAFTNHEMSTLLVTTPIIKLDGVDYGVCIVLDILWDGVCP